MNKKVNFEQTWHLNPNFISESLETIMTLLEEYKGKDGYQRLYVIYIVKTGQANSIRSLCEITEQGTTSVSRWLKTYQDKGIEGLLDISYETIRHLHSKMIIESEEILLNLLQQCNHQKTFRRLRALYLIKTGQVERPKELTKILGYKAHVSVGRLLRRYQQKGIDILIEGKNKTEVFDRTIDIYPDKIPESLCPVSLAKRLGGVSLPTLRHNRHKRTFYNWTKHNDPDSIGWKWNPTDGRYYRLK